MIDLNEEVLADAFALYLSDNDKDEDSISVTHLPDLLKTLGMYDYFYGEAAGRSQRMILREAMKSLDPNDSGRIDFMAYTNVMPLLAEGINNDLKKEEGSSPPASKRFKKNDSDITNDSPSDSSVLQDFLLFTNGEKRKINFDDLKRIATEIKDDATDEELLEMLQLHHKGEGAEITLKDFYNILQQANIS